ncbi:uncharacterized protein LOC126979328 [Leptidea sinapis]|uniref:uncharacterized protein LOC126979328 n=1 Tax=Leptidea sinapis TaxID=189913 RepID=UPI0021C3AE79|nr:uncharacterized protein LOC126979328 [Leptidea sinapis]
MEGVNFLFRTLCTVTILFSISAYATEKKLIVDHDGGADDAMAIFLALLNEKYFDGPEVVAITTTHGNVDENQVFYNTQRILNVAQRPDVPIYRGSPSALIRDFPSDLYFGYDGLGDNTTTVEPIAAQKENAAEALIAFSKKLKGGLTIVTLGPLTNIALAMKLDADFMSRLSQIFIAASYIYTDNIPQKVEFNVKMDIEAYYIVVENGLLDKVTLIPSTTVKSYLNLGKVWRLDILGKIQSNVIKAMNVYERISLSRSNDWHPLDAAAMSIVLNAMIVGEVKYTWNYLNLCGNRRGMTENNFNFKTPNAKIIYTLKKEAYRVFLLKIFSADVESEN